MRVQHEGTKYQKCYHTCTSHKSYVHYQQVAERYAKWRRVLQKEHTLKSKLQLEKVSNEPRLLSHMVALTHHKPFWDNIAQLLLWAATTTLPQNE